MPRENSEKGRFLRKGKWILFGCITMVVATAIFVCLYSLECRMEPQFVGAVRLDSAQVSAGQVACEPWHTVYGSDDQHSGTWYHPHEYYQTRAIDPWPEMDLENYTYIITYGREIQSASYYLCREIDVPIRTGEKEAHLVLTENIEPLTIYIYKIPKVRINNPDIY